MSAVAPLIGRYCGTKIPPEIQSSSGLLSLSFHTDMAVAKDGFSARYNLTRKEVSECECQTASAEAVPALCGVCFCLLPVFLPRSISKLQTSPSVLTLSLLSSSLDCSYPPDLYCPDYFNVLSFFRSSSSPEITLCQNETCAIFFSNIN